MNMDTLLFNVATSARISAGLPGKSKTIEVIPIDVPKREETPREVPVKIPSPVIIPEPEYEPA